LVLKKIQVGFEADSRIDIFKNFRLPKLSLIKTRPLTIGVDLKEKKRVSYCEWLLDLNIHRKYYKANFLKLFSN